MFCGQLPDSAKEVVSIRIEPVPGSVYPQTASRSTRGQGDIEVFRQGHGQGRWPGNRRDDRNACTGRFLNQFVADTRGKNDHGGRRQVIVQKQTSDDLIQCIVPPNVFGRGQ